MRPIKRRHFIKAPEVVNRAVRELTPADQKDLGFFTPFSENLFPPKPLAPSLISSSEGKLDVLLLTIPSYAVIYSAYANAYTDILSKLPNRTKVIILTHRSVEETVKCWLSCHGYDNTSKVISVKDHINFSVWAEDPYVVVRDTDIGKGYFVEPFSFHRSGDSLISDFVSNATDYNNSQAPLYFQGGNLLVGDSFFFIGIDYPKESLKYIGDIITNPSGLPGEELIRNLYKEYMDKKRDLYYIGSTIPVPGEQFKISYMDNSPFVELLYQGNQPNTKQPIFHIDMFITLVGRDNNKQFQIMIGDPGKAAEILNDDLPPNAMQEVFDNIASILSQKGFNVIINPLPLVFVDDEWDIDKFRESSENGTKGAADVVKYMEKSNLNLITVRKWYFATPNNALVQNAEGEKRVWLPSYGYGEWNVLCKIDLEMKRLWESLGFEVYLLGDFHPFAENLGAVHCVSKFLQRS